jgi:hypothetical protein
MFGRPNPAFPLLVSLVCAFLVTAALAYFVVGVKQTAAAAPDYRAVDAGSLQYETMLGRPLDPQDSIDKQITAGLAPRDRRVRRGQLLFGAFIAVTNSGPRTVTSADRIDLRDDAGHVYAPLHLPAGNPYAYSAHAIPPHTQIPPASSVAGNNLAATGLLLVYRIPSGEYENGTPQLMVHPHGRGGAASFVI